MGTVDTAGARRYLQRGRGNTLYQVEYSEYSSTLIVYTYYIIDRSANPEHETQTR